VADFYADLRDIRFNLFDCFDVGSFTKHERYKDADLATMNDILDAAEQQAREILFPCNETGDRVGVKFEAGKVTLPPGFKEAYKAFSESGWLALSMRPEDGGQGFPLVLHIASQEMFTAANVNLMFTPGLTHGALGLIQTFGTADQKATYVDKMLSGEWSGTMCLTEPSAGTAVPDLRSVARPIADKPGFFRIKGQKVFIQAGSGGVGTFAIQLAKHLGATVATTTGTGNVALVKRLGADVVVDYKTQDFEDVLRDYDVVLNSQEGKTLDKSLRVLKDGGKLISISGPPDPAFGKKIGAPGFVRLVMRLLSAGVRRKARSLAVAYAFLFMEAAGGQLRQLTLSIEAGYLRQVPERVFRGQDHRDDRSYPGTGRPPGP